ncbi:MAG: tyrosine recombinase XerC [Ruminococcaceae bacterium]|nr:tyrosine recombinase XerC [Oscillospiraceae bacterium]
MAIARSTLPQLLREFLIDLNVVKNKSNLTVEEYASDLRTFLLFITSKQTGEKDFSKIDISHFTASDFAQLTNDDVYEFLAFCKTERDNSAKTRARKLSSIRMFYRFLANRHYIASNPMSNLESPKIEKTLPKFLTLEQSIDLLNCIDGPNKERDFCIITLFLNCGMRLAELVSLNYNDISYTNNSVYVIITGKGNKQRMVYLNQACVDAIASYMRVRPKDGVIDKNALFLSDRRQRISPKTVQHLVKTYLEKAGLGDGYSVHKLRHTAATLMYQHGHVDTLALKEILGHESLATTQIYTHVSVQQLKAAADSNPLASYKSTKSEDKSVEDDGDN